MPERHGPLVFVARGPRFFEVLSFGEVGVPSSLSPRPSVD